MVSQTERNSRAAGAASASSYLTLVGAGLLLKGRGRTAALPCLTDCSRPGRRGPSRSVPSASPRPRGFRRPRRAPRPTRFPRIAPPPHLEKPKRRSGRTSTKQANVARQHTLHHGGRQDIHTTPNVKYITPPAVQKTSDGLWRSGVRLVSKNSATWGRFRAGFPTCRPTWGRFPNLPPNVGQVSQPAAQRGAGFPTCHRSRFFPADLQSCPSFPPADPL